MASPSNPFDEFDKHLKGKRAEEPAANPFDQFDDIDVPIDRAVAQQEAKTAGFQAKAQADYEARQAEIAKQDQLHPQWAPNRLVVDEAPAVNPYLEHLKPQLPPSPVQKFGAQFKMDMLGDEQTQRAVMARSLFPDVPLEKSMKRVGFYDGNPVYIDDKGEMQQLSSGMTRFLANMTANSPEMIASVAGSELGPFGTAGGASLAHGLKRTIAGALMDEPFDPIDIGKGMAIEGAMGAAGDLPGRAVGMVGNRRALFNMTPRELNAARYVQERIKRDTDIDLDLAQASGNRRLISARNFGAREPASAEIYQAQDERALGQLHDYQDKVLDSIASAKPGEIAEAGGVNAADAALRTARREVSAKVRPLYNAAYAKNPTVTDPDVLKFLQLPYFPEAYAAGQRIAELEGQAAPMVMGPATTVSKRAKHPSGTFYQTQSTTLPAAPISQPDLRSLDYLKQGLDDQIQKLVDAGDTKLAGALMQQRTAFVEALDRLPSPEYKAARELYSRLRAARIDPLENGPVGVLAKLKNKDAVGAAAKVFGDADVTPTQIRFAKQAIVSEPGGREAWDDLTRAWLSKAFDRARTESQAGVEVNPAGKSRQELYGNRRLQAKMDEILPPGSTTMFGNLMEASQMLSRTRLAGSNTAVDTEFREVLKGRALNAFKWMTTFRKKAIDTAEQAAVEKGSVEVAEAMTDPTKFKHMQRVLRMRPSVQRAILLSTIIGARTGQEALRTGLTSPVNTFAKDGSDALGE
jgi:hypothetical protein